ncbi:NAC domain-containing protein 41-like [Rhododendron vialii]|uniref:NAC domain-containing protein 41-like n=1 Tax=Rhododendron vialii TaxID=182163 RepID=UPI00265F6617|nr:NAC domain-containing protein 41-like [Rhododendron vialii]
MTTVPSGYFFRPTDKQLLEDYLRRKSEGNSLPCDVVIEREIYGAGNKAPWQIFTDEDPWEICETMDKKTDKLKTEGTIYVFTTLIKASENSDRIARTAGCGSWHGETALEPVLDKKGGVMGNKRMLCFQITDESLKECHWIMHEYSLPVGNATNGKGEYVLCRIKRDDSKDTKISSRKRKNVEGATTDDDLPILKPSKRVRTKFVQEQKMECDAAVAPKQKIVPFLEEPVVQECDSAAVSEPEVVPFSDVPFSQESIVQDQSFIRIGDPHEFTLEDMDEILGYLDEQVSVEKQQESSFGLDNDYNNFGNIGLDYDYEYDYDDFGGLDYDYDDFGNILLMTEVDPSGLALASSEPLPIEKG